MKAAAAKKFVHAIPEHHLQDEQTADGDLYLALKGNRAATASQWQSSLFPTLRAALDERNVGQAGLSQVFSRTCCPWPGVAGYVEGFIPAKS